MCQRLTHPKHCIQKSRRHRAIWDCFLAQCKTEGLHDWNWDPGQAKKDSPTASGGIGLMQQKARVRVFAWNKDAAYGVTVKSAYGFAAHLNHLVIIRFLRLIFIIIIIILLLLLLCVNVFSCCCCFAVFRNVVLRMQKTFRAGVTDFVAFVVADVVGLILLLFQLE